MIKQYLWVGALAFAMIVIQTTMARFAGDKMMVDFIFVMVVIIGIYKDPVHGAIMSFGLGFLQDVFSADVAGLHMFARVAIFIGAYLLKGKLSPDASLAKFSMALLLGALDRVMILVLALVFGDPYQITPRFVALVLCGTFINAALTPIIYYPFLLIPGFVERRKGPAV